MSFRHPSNNSAEILAELAETLRRAADLIDALHRTQQSERELEPSQSIPPDGVPLAPKGPSPQAVGPHPALSVGQGMVGRTKARHATTEVATTFPQSDPGEQERLREWLTERRVEVITQRQPDPADYVLDEHAWYIGQRYDRVRPLLQALKRTQGSRTLARLFLHASSAQQVSDCCQLAMNLKRDGILSQYSYKKTPERTLYARLSRSPFAINFITGGWMERFIVTTLSQMISCYSHPPVAWVLNPQIRFADGQEGELDILFSLGGAVFHIEAKTGDFEQYLHSYSKLRDRLRLDTEHSILVVAGLDDATAARMRALHGLHVVGLSEFEPRIHNLLEPLLGEPVTDQS